MSGDKLTIEEQLERGLLLEVDLDGDGALEQIFAPVKANLGKFGQILKDSAKLIGSDIGYLVKLTFGRLKSLSELKQMRDKNNQRRQKYIQSIAKNSDELMNSWPDGKVTSMMLAPGVFFTSTTLTGVQNVFSPEFRSTLGEYGLDSVPFFGAWFGAQGGDKNQFLRSLESCEPGDGECFSKAFSSLGGGGGNDQGTLSKLAHKINDIFLFAHHTMDGNLLEEGDDNEKEVEVSRQVAEIMIPEIQKMISDFFKEERSNWMKSQLKYCDSVTNEAATVIALNITLGSADTSKVFFETLAALKEKGGDNIKDLNVEDVQKGFKELGQKMRDDKETMKKIEEDFEENKIEKTEDNLNNKLEELVLTSFKSTFLPELKNNLTDYYEAVYTEITGGLTNDQRKLISKDSTAKEYLAKIDEYEKKMKDALSKAK